MIIIISKTFKKKYLEKLSKYFSTNDFIGKIKKIKLINLKYPHFKIKLKINLVDFRGVVLIKKEKYFNKKRKIFYTFDFMFKKR